MPKQKVTKKIIIEKPQDDSGMNFLAAIVLLVIFALIIWYWGLPALSGKPAQINVNLQMPSPSVSQSPTSAPTSAPTSVVPSTPPTYNY